MAITMKYLIRVVTVLAILCIDLDAFTYLNNTTYDGQKSEIAAGRAGYAVNTGGALRGLLIESDSNLPRALSNFTQFTISLWVQIPREEVLTTERILLDKSSSIGSGNTLGRTGQAGGTGPYGDRHSSL